jgi:hypothetical protein
VRLLQYRYRINSVMILSFDQQHALLLKNHCGDHLIVRAGFASGYKGTGPHGLSFVLELLFAHGVEIDECAIPEALMNRLNVSALTLADLALVKRTTPVRPSSWSDYVFKEDFEAGQNGTLWRRIEPVMPFGIIDSRLIDLALKLHDDPDDCLLKGYRRLEDFIRERSSIEDHGTKLLSRVFLSEPPLLTWLDVDESERRGRASLFTAVFMAYRNPRAHREPYKYGSDLAEFLMLNQLFLLEAAAVDKRGRRARPKNELSELIRRADGGGKWKRSRKKRRTKAR